MFEGNKLTELVQRLRGVFVGIGSITDFLQINKIKTSLIYPPADSTTAIQVAKADGTTGVLTVDTTNVRVGIGVTPTQALDVVGVIKANNNVIVVAATGTEPVANNPIECHTSAAGAGIVAFNTFTAGSASGGIIRAAYGGIPSAADQRLGLLIYGATTTGSTQTSTAGVSGWSAELWDSTHAGAYLRLETTATASTSRTERLRVTAAGSTRVGGGAMTNTDAAGNLEVTGATFLLSDTTIADAKNIILSATTGTQIGTAANQKLGFYGAVPVAQRANANQAAAPAGGTGATAGAYDTAAHRDALIALVNEMRTVLINLGLMKGSA